jgi:hypothetical protein
MAIRTVPRFVLGIACLVFPFLGLAQPLDHFSCNTSSGLVTNDNPFAVTLQAMGIDGLPATNWQGQIELAASVEKPSAPVITEVFSAGGVIEIGNPGPEPVDLSNWEIQALPYYPAYYSPPTAPNARLRFPVGTVLPSQSVFTWSDRGVAPGAFPAFVSSKRFSSQIGTFCIARLLNAGGDTMDEVYLNYSAPAPPSAFWKGYGLPACPANLSFSRVGFANHFNSLDWRTNAPSLGIMNPDLQLPWTNSGRFLATSPSMIQMSNGVWTGFVTVSGGASGTFWLKANNGEGVSGASAPIALVESPAIKLVVPPGVSAASESKAGFVGNLTVLLPAASANDLPVSITLSDTNEFAAPTKVVIPAGSNTVQVPITNLDDNIADGDALITLSAVSSGYSTASVTLTNSDDESGTLYLMVPASLPEDYSFGTEQGQVFLSEVARHDVLVRLRADPPVEVPDSLLIPKGRLSQSFQLSVGDDSVVNPVPRQARVQAQTANWPWAESVVNLIDDEDGSFAINLPSRMVEGTTATGRILVNTPHAADTVFTLTSRDPNLKVPTTVTLAAGTSGANFVVEAVDNSTPNMTVRAQVDAQTEGQSSISQTVTIQDDEINIHNLSLSWIPPVVFSGQPFAFDASLIDSGWQLQRTNAPGRIDLIGATNVARLVMPSNPIPFTNGTWTNNLLIEGEAYGVHLDVSVAGFQASSAQFDVLMGCDIPIALSDAVWNKVGGKFLVAEAAQGDVPARLTEIDPWTGARGRTMDLSMAAKRVAVSDDGQVAWLATTANTFQRIDLAGWHFDREYPIDVSNTNAFAMEIAALPGDSERFVAAIYSNSAYKMVVYDHGQPLANRATLPGSSDITALVPGRPGEVFCQSHAYLSRLLVVSNGIALDRAVFVSYSYGSNPNLFYEDGRLLRGTGEMFSPDTLASVEPFPTTSAVLGILCADKNKALFVEGDLLKAYDLTSHQVQGSHSFPYSIGSAPRFLRWSQKGLATFIPGQSLTLFQTPLLTANLPDLVLTAHVPETDFKPINVDLANFNWEYGITNHGSGIAPAVVLHLNTGATRSLGSLAPGEGVSVMIPPANIYMGGVAIVTATVDCDLADSNPQDNTTTATIRIGTQAMPSTSQVILGMTHLIASPTGDRLYAAVAKSAGELVDGVAVVNPETGTVEQILPVGPEPKHLTISSDGNNLYVLLGTNQLVRWNLKASTNDLSICFTNETVFDFAPVPGSPRSLVVATSEKIAVFDDDRMRPTTYTSISERRYVGFTGNILWASEPGYLTSFNLSSAGLSTISTRTFGRYADFCSPLTGDDTHLYISGAILDITSGLRHDLYGDQFAADPANGCAFTIVGNNLCKYSLGYYDLTGQQLLPVRADVYPSAADPVRWGKGGLAVRSGQQLLMIRSPLVPDAASVNLSVSITPPVAPIPYETVEWSITLTNNSDQAAARTMLTVNMGDLRDMQFEGSYSYQSYSTLLYDAGDMPAHASATVKIRGWSFEGSITFSASIQTAATDTNRNDNTATASVPVIYQPVDLSMRLISAPEQVQVGEEFDVTFVLTNAGPGSARHAAMLLKGTEGLQFIGVVGNTFPINEYAMILGTVEAGESKTAVLRYKALAQGLLPVAVSSYSYVPDTVSTNDLSTALVYVSPNQTNQSLTELMFPVGSITAWDRSRQQVLAIISSSLFILDPASLKPVSEIPLPYGAQFIAPCNNGIHAWVSLAGGSAVRVNLETGALDQQFAYDPAQSPVYSIATPPGQSNILVVAYDPGYRGNNHLEAFDNGRRLPNGYGPLGWSDGGEPMIFTPDGRLFMASSQILRELRVTPDGLAEVQRLDSAALNSELALSYASSRLFFTSGRVVDLDTSAIDDRLLNSALLVADDETGFAYSATGSRILWGGAPMTISRYDATTLALQWRQEFPMPYSDVSRILTMGTNGCAIFGNKVWLLRPEQMGPAKPDLGLALSINSVAPETSTLFSIQVAITNKSPWASAQTLLSLELPSGLVFAPGSTFDGTNSATIDLGLVSRGTNLTFLVSALTNGSFTIHAAVTNAIMHLAPADSQQELLVSVMPPPIFLFDDIAVLDGAAYQEAVLTGRLSRPAIKDIRVSWSITLLTAQAKDFSETSGVFMFPAGRTTAICTPIASHFVPALDKTALLTFTSSDVFLARSNALLTILNDDFPQVSVTNVTVVEGNSSITNAGFKVTLSASAPFPVDVRFQMTPGTATPGLDYISRQGWLHFNSGETVKTISVPVIGDTIYEPNETASLVLLEAVHASFANSQGLLTIKNDDRTSPSVLSVASNTGGLQISFQSESGAIYQVQSRTNLTTDGWHTMPGTLQGDGSPMAFPLSEPMGDSVFFRVTAK